MQLRVIALQWACVMSWSSACTPRDCASLQYLTGPCKQVWSNGEGCAGSREGPTGLCAAGSAGHGAPGALLRGHVAVLYACQVRHWPHGTCHCHMFLNSDQHLTSTDGNVDATFPGFPVYLARKWLL